MRKAIKIIFTIAVFSQVFALEFGQVGNTPASVGGAGVAYKNNAWSVFYNPAILAANRKASVAYSFGAGYSDNNVLELTSIDIDALKNIKDEVSNITKGTSTASTPTTRSVRSISTQGSNSNSSDKLQEKLGLLGEVLSNLTGNGSGSSSGTGGSSDKTFGDLCNYLCGKAGNGNSNNCNSGSSGTGSTGTSNCDLQNVATSLQSNTNALNDIKKELVTAIDKTAQNHPDSSTALGLLGSIIDNIDPNDIPNLIEGVKDGSADLSTVLKKISAGGIKINKGVSPALDSLFMIVDTINKNSMNVTSNNGIVWAIKGSKNRGAIGMGILANAYVFAGIELDASHKRIIIQNNSDYFEVGVSGDKIILSSSDSTAYNNHSVLANNANHNLHAKGLILSEIPIAYGHTIPLPIGDLHLGATFKYMFAVSMDNSQRFNFDNLKLNFSNLGDTIDYTHTFGIDLGALYTMKWLGVGLVAKNLNAPLINTVKGKYRILPQVRAGLSAEVWKLTFLLDIDLTPNTTLEPNKLNQMVGGGMILDLRWVDFRFGVMGDMHKNPYGPIFTMGVNIVHFLDITLQTSAKLVDLGEYAGGVKMPNYFKVNIGGRFQW